MKYIAQFLYAVFFYISRHSLLATRLLSRIHETFGIQLSVRDLFQFPTISDIAIKLDGVQDKKPLR